MSFQPPKSNRPGSIPGYLVVLAAFSVLVLLFSVAMGLIAFGVIDLGGDDEVSVPPATQIVGTSGEPLQMSGFTILETREVNGRPEIDVNVSATNTGDERLTNTTMLVQCLDGGNVSNSQLILGIDPDQTLQFELTLYGTGDPSCAGPVVSFDVD